MDKIELTAEQKLKLSEDAFAIFRFTKKKMGERGAASEAVLWIMEQFGISTPEALGLSDIAVLEDKVIEAFSSAQENNQTPQLDFLPG